MIGTSDGASFQPKESSESAAPPKIHRTAVVDPKAQIGRGVEIGPYTIVGGDVTIGDGTWIGSGCLIEGWTTIGRRCRIFHSAVVGSEPQDLKYKGERTFLKIGDGNTVREFATLHRATGEGLETVVGDGNFIMAYAHIAHNCTVGTGVVLANSVNMAGHVTIGDHATVGGVTVIHQFVRIGKYSIIGGGLRIPMDIVPYVKVGGYPARVNGLNVIGLERHGFSPETRRILKETYKILFHSNLNVTQAVKRVRSDVPPIPEVMYLVEFIESSRRGITL